MKAGEFQRHLVRLGLTYEQAADILGLSRDHVRALASGRDTITPRVAADLRALSLDDASDARLTQWMRNDFVPARVKRTRPRR